MTDNQSAVIQRIEAMLWQALVLADTIDVPLLCAKIDDAVHCARAMARPHLDS